MKSARRCRWSFYALTIAWGVYICVMPFLRSPDHIAIARSIFLIFDLHFIVFNLLG